MESKVYSLIIFALIAGLIVGFTITYLFFQNQILSIQLQVSVLQLDVIEKDAQILSLQNTIQDLNNEIDDLESQIDEYLSKIHETDRWAVIQDSKGDIIAIETSNNEAWNTLSDLFQNQTEMWIGGIVEEYNNKWGFRFDPNTIIVAQFTIEGAQSYIQGISEDLDYWINTWGTYTYVFARVIEVNSLDELQMQVRIDMVDWNVVGDSVTLTVRNTGSVPAEIESISIRENDPGSTWYSDETADATGAIDVGDATTFTWDETGGASGADFIVNSESYLIRVTTTTGFYYEMVAATPAA
jgi:cell division protein FtsL